MKRLTTRLHRALLFVLALMPLSQAICRMVTVSVLPGAVFLIAQTTLLALVTLLPAYVGNYREYEVVQYEGKRTSDPNPDREAVHTLVSEGRRFPLRLAADILVTGLVLAVALLLPGDLFIGGKLARKIAFAVMQTALALIAAHDLPVQTYIWGDIPGMFLGVLSYLGMALFLHFTKADVASLQTLISVCAVLYLFFGAVALNRQSIAASMSTHSGEERRAPGFIVLRNRRIVIAFASVVTLISLPESVRRAVLWLLSQIGRLVRLLRGAGDTPSSSPLPPMLQSTVMQAVPEAAPVEEMAADMGGSSTLVYIFLGFICLCILWLLYEFIKKLSAKLASWMERFAHNVGEGFYDEKEELMTADELRDRMAAGLKRGLESLFKREKPWRELTGRERARRLMKTYYKKRAGKVKNLRAKTAREVLSEGVLSQENRETFSRAYDAARYSEHEVSAEKMEEIKKDLRL